MLKCSWWHFVYWLVKAKIETFLTKTAKKYTVDVMLIFELRKIYFTQLHFTSFHFPSTTFSFQYENCRRRYKFNFEGCLSLHAIWVGKYEKTLPFSLSGNKKNRTLSKTILHDFCDNLKAKVSENFRFFDTDFFDRILINRK